MDVHSIFFCKCNLCLETVNTTSELTYHRVWKCRWTLTTDLFT
jgi:hypothetical protein